jgi:hypothetical protein
LALGDNMAFANSLGFDISAVTRSTISDVYRVDRAALRKRRTFVTASTVALSRVGRFARHALRNIASKAAGKFADIVLPGFQERTDQLAKHAMVFERLHELMIEEMVLTGVVHHEDLVEPIEKLQSVQTRRIAELRSNVADLMSINSRSRLAAAYSRRVAMLVRTQNALEAVKISCIPNEHAAVVFSQVHALQARIDHGLATFMEDEEFDPELVALADAALERIGENSKVTTRD